MLTCCAFLWAVTGCDLVDVIRRGDILAALCQEEQGDHSTVTRPQFEDAVARHRGAAYKLSTNPDAVVAAAPGHVSRTVVVAGG